jgi:transposase
MESSVVMRKPAEILDEDHELVIERVCAIDVAKASGMVCTRLPQGAAVGRRVSRVWEVAATTRAVTELADHLVAVGIEQVTVESTSDYWRIWFYLLEARGLDVQLVNARDVKNLPGRPKTDKLDAVWLAKLTEKGLLRPSFVPPAEIRVLRDYTRLRVDLTRERTRHWQRLEKLLEDALIKVSSVASKLDTRSVRDMLEALIAGDRDPRRLAELARGRMKTKRAALVEALSGRFDEHHAEIARVLLDQIDGLSAAIEKLTTRAELLLQTLLAARASDQQAGGAGGAVHAPSSGNPCQAPTKTTEVPAEAPIEASVPADGTLAHRGGNLSAAQRLDEIAGIGPLAAQVIIAEIGLEMSRFPTAGHLVSWAKLCPRTIQSGATRRGGAAGKGNPYLKGVLGEAAAAAAKTNTFLGERYRRLVKRRGKLKALVAVARSILVIVWHLLSDPTARFYDLGPDYHTHRIDTTRKIRNHVSGLTALGFRVTLEPTA